MSSDNKGIVNKKTNLFFVFGYFMTALLYVFAVVYNVDLLRDIASFLLLTLVFRANTEHLTAIMIALAFMWHYCKYSNGMSIFFVFSIACVIRYLFNQRFKFTLNMNAFFLVLVILIQQLVLVFFENQYDRLFQWIGGMAYFFIVLIDKNVIYNHKTTIKYLACSYIAVTVGNYMAGVLSYGNDFILRVIMYGSDDYRLHFGQQLDSQGGSNYFPILSFVLAFAIINEYFKENFSVKKIYLFLLSISILALAFLTYTRAYVITIAIIVLITMVQTFTKNSKKIIGFLPLGGIAGLIIYILVSEQINDIAIGFVSRFSSENVITVGGRFNLLVYFFEVISDNISILFFGAGVKGYVYQFGNIMAHNIYLDGILCFGVSGFLVVIVLFITWSKKLCRTTKDSPTIFSAFGLLALLLQWLTIGSFFYEYTFYYLLFVILILYFGYTKNKRDILLKKF